MYIEQLYTKCLAEAAYYIESDGEAVIIDPIRETEPYTDMAASRGATIKYVFETHFHADFVSGHVDLARNTGAQIVYGPGAAPEFPAIIAEDGQEFKVGKITLKVLHTPGHTPESSCYLLKNEQGKDHAVFTGDTLFIGDVGRPDLAVSSNLSREDLAGMLYDSLRNKVMTLGDDVIVYPAHGAGSACGKNIGKETVSTIGAQKATNYALQQMDKATFIKEILTGLSAPPSYFFMDALINKQGYEPLGTVRQKGLTGLSAAEVEQAIKDNSTLALDTRAPAEFAEGHIPGSLNIGLDGQFAIWAATLLSPEKKIILITAGNREEEAVDRLARVGLDTVAGVLKGGIGAWKAEGRTLRAIPTIDPEKFVELSEGVKVLDVRNEGEFSSGVIPGATLIPLGQLESRLNELGKQDPYYIHCAGGYRSMIAASIVEKAGLKPINVNGGMGALRQAGIRLLEPAASK